MPDLRFWKRAGYHPVMSIVPGDPVRAIAAIVQNVRMTCQVVGRGIDCLDEPDQFAPQKVLIDIQGNSQRNIGLQLLKIGDTVG